MRRKKLLEQTIEDAASDRAQKELGVRSSKLDSRGHRGMPDRCFWVQGGSPLIVEFKRIGEVPTPLQEYHLEQFRSAGYRTAVLTSADECLEILRSMVEAVAVSRRGIKVRPTRPAIRTTARPRNG